MKEREGRRKVGREQGREREQHALKHLEKVRNMREEKKEWREIKGRDLDTWMNVWCEDKIVSV